MKIKGFLVKIISTFFYVGFLPLVPGTFGSMAGVLVFYLVKGSGILQAVATLLVLLAGFISCGEAEKVFKKKDPKFVVIDEVAGMLISLSFLPDYSLKVVVMAFLLFRILDTLKPYPASRLEDLHGGVGIMSDDILAGVYANIILQVVLRALSFKTV